MYLPRTLDRELTRALSHAPAVSIDGPKAVGKTETAKRFAASQWLLDDPDDLAGYRADETVIRRARRPVLIDEWQRHPHSWDTVRRWVDDGAPSGSVILTGSATPVAGVDTHSGPGRIVSLRMRPMALFERGIETPTVSVRDLLAGSASIEGRTEVGTPDYLECICASGFPGILRNTDAETRGDLLDGYLRRIVDRDLPEAGYPVRRADTLRRWLTAYAAATSTTTAYSRILDATTAADGSQPAKTTTIAYRDHLTAVWLLDPLPGWTSSLNPFARLQAAPNHHVADPALAARLLRLTPETMVRGRGAALAGPLFQSLATLTLRVAAQPLRADVSHLRTRNRDHEVDLILEGRAGGILAVEVKLASEVTDSDVRHLHWLRHHLGEEIADLVVINTGASAYRRRDGVAVVPLALLGP